MVALIGLVAACEFSVNVSSAKSYVYKVRQTISALS